MSFNSSTVAAADTVTATERNNLRKDIAVHAADYLVDSGAANAYIVTVDNQITSLATGQVVKFKAVNANTGASTLRFKNSLALDITDNIVHRDSSSLVAGDIPADSIVICIFDGTNWQFQSAKASAKCIDDVYTANENLIANDRLSLIDLQSGKVEKCVRHRMITDTVSAAIGGTTDYLSSCKVSDSKICVFYKDGTAFNAIIGTINAVTLATTLGSETAVRNSGDAGSVQIRCLYMSDDKIAFLYSTTDNHIRMRIATISGTTPTLGTEIDLLTATTVHDIGMDLLDTDKIAIALHYNNGADDVLDVFNVTVSGTTVTSYIVNVVTQTDADNASNGIGVTTLNTGETIISYGNDTTQLYSWKVTWVGNVPTSSTKTSTNDGTGVPTYINSAKVGTGSYALVCWRDVSDNDIYVRPMRPGDIGTKVNVIDTIHESSIGNSQSYLSMDSIDADNTRFIIAGRSTAVDQVEMFEIVCTGATPYAVSGWNNIFSPGDYNAVTKILGSRNRFAVVHDGTINIQEEYDNTDKYIGCAIASASAAASVAVRKGGKLGGFAGLTAGEEYYMDYLTDTLTTSDIGAYVGFSISTTEIDIDITRKQRYSSIPFSKAIYNITGRHKIYHNLGALPKKIRMKTATNIDIGGSSGEGNCDAVYDYGKNIYSYLFHGSRGDSTASSNGAGASVIADGVGTATISNVDKFSITVNWSDVSIVNQTISMMVEASA